MNNVTLIGRLAKDPELRYTSTGKPVVGFPLAVNRPFSQTDEADFFNIVVWGKQAENCANYITKGRLIGIEGRLQTRKYEGKEGIIRYVTEIIANRVEFLDYKKDDKTNKGKTSNSKEKTKKASNEDLDDFSDISIDEFEALEEDDIEIPF